MDALTTPSNWQRVRLGDIAEIIGGGTPSTQVTSFWNGSINWFTPTEIGITKYVHKSQRTITPLGLKKSSAKLLPIGTILLTSRASIGDCAILKVVATTNQGFQSLIPLEKINNEFLYYLILTLKNKLLKLASGSTFLEVSPNKIKNLLIPLPPLNEQIAIANILSDVDHYLYSLDALILKKESVKKALSFELLSQRKRLKGFNQNWQRVRLGDIANYLTSNLSAEQITQQGKIKVYDVNNFIGYTDTTFISDKPYISIVKDGSVGRVRILPPKTNILSTMGALVANHKTTTEFLFYLLSNFDFKNFTSGSIIPHIYFKDYKEKTIFLPSLDEQAAIANILSALDHEIISLKNKKRQFENIKKALNHDLMSAKIRVLKNKRPKSQGQTRL
ncbi:restriction endonuclease subunit S [Helicobacter pylori]|uniref:restriction endonuclease subunit S n=3 Tax=Helicobacter pylori TaxID=210 RepID=UPI000E2711B1|nr:restriction endonuclease subunit S [Helicobacter pylori]RDY79235.1 restriction endonuclease subunit S [Helicobacter pylori]WQX56259.1 restriction endonuclease subunit S [Helicobacter pylori]WQX56357.1 restriction endonuclease subunit S [Helicobacter pylori]